MNYRTIAIGVVLGSSGLALLNNLPIVCGLGCPPPILFLPFLFGGSMLSVVGAIFFVLGLFSKNKDRMLKLCLVILVVIFVPMTIYLALPYFMHWR